MVNYCNILDILKPDLVQLELIKVSEKSITVINVEFSENGNYLAISYDYKKVSWRHKNIHEDIIQTKGPQGGFVTIFTHCDSLNKASYGGKQRQENSMYIKNIEIKCPLLESKSSLSNNLVASQMVFSEDSRFIMIYFMPMSEKVDEQLDPKEGVYVLWDIQTNSNVNVKLWGSHEHKLASIKFPLQIWGHYNYLKEASNGNFINPEAERKSFDMVKGMQIYSDKIDCTSMHDNEKIIFIGSKNGQIHVIKSIAMNYPKNEIPGSLMLL